jgi:peptidyl-prolyl cis-trans isomerase D
MLTNLRLKSQNFMIFILFGMLIFVFVFFFGPQSQGFSPGGSAATPTGVAATVGETDIPSQHVEMAVRRLGDVESDALPRLRREALMQLVDQEVLAQRARAAGLAVDDAQLLAYTFSKDNPDYQLFLGRDGKPDHDRYELYVTQFFGTNSADYLQSKGREVLAQRYLDFIEQQIKVSDAAVKAAFVEANTSWTLEFVAVDPAVAAQDVAPATAEAGVAYAAAHADEVSAYYEANKSEFVHGKEVRVRRILVKVAKDADAAAQKAAEDKINGLLAEAKAAPEKFADLAREKSEGYYAQMGGELGWQTEANSDKNDYPIYTALEVGQISAVQSNAVGKWFVRAEEVKPAVNQALDAVKNDIGQRLATKSGKDTAARAVAEAIHAKVAAGASLLEATPKAPAEPAPPAPEPIEGEAPVAPEAPAEPKPLYEVQTTPPIAASRPAWDRFPLLGKSEALARALSKLSADKPLVPEVIALDGGRLAVLRLKESTAPDDSKFDEQKVELARKLRQQRVLQLVGYWRAPLLGPVAQREMFRKIIGGPLLASLPVPGTAGIRINEAMYPGTPASVPASGAN